MPHGRCPPLLGLVVGGLGLSDALVEDLSVLVGSILGRLCAAALERNAVALVLEALRSDQALDLGGLGVWLRALLLGLDLAADNELANIIILAETEEAAELGGTLGTKTLGQHGVSQAGDVGITLLDDGEGEDGQVHADDAATDGLPLALSITARSVARVALAEEESHTGRVHDTLLHREALLVVAAGDLEDVALELVADAVTWDFLTHAAVHEDAQLALVIDLDQLLRAIRGVGDVELHLDGCWVKISAAVM